MQINVRALARTSLLLLLVKVLRVARIRLGHVGQLASYLLSLGDFCSIRIRVVGEPGLGSFRFGRMLYRWEIHPE